MTHENEIKMIDNIGSLSEYQEEMTLTCTMLEKTIDNMINTLLDEMGFPKESERITRDVPFELLLDIDLTSQTKVLKLKKLLSEYNESIKEDKL